MPIVRHRALRAHQGPYIWIEWMRVLGAGAFLVAVVLSPSASLAQAGADGEALFKTKCTGCHSVKKVLDGVRKMSEAQRAAQLDKFLSTHFAADAGQRAAIAAYLIQAAAR